MKPADHIWPGSVRAFIYLCFLMLSLILVSSLDHYMHHTLNQSVHTTIQKQEKIFLGQKETLHIRDLFPHGSMDPDDERST